MSATITIRVYGICINASNEILMTHEAINGYHFNKFPGGGHEEGEGLIDTLRREFMEECGVSIDQIRHFYTTDFFQASHFNPDVQVISVYYQLSCDFEKIKAFHFKSTNDFSTENNTLELFWINIDKCSSELFTFPIDQHVFNEIKRKYLN